MAGNVITDVGGIAREETPGQAEDLYGPGGAGMIPGLVNEVTPERGQELAQAEADTKMAGQLNPVGKFAAGSLQGATFGLGLPLMIKGADILGIDSSAARHNLAGLNNEGMFGAYGAGKVAGLLAGTALTGGALEEAGAAAGLSSLIPEATGITGQAIAGAGKLGFQGGVDGALTGLGSAVEQSVLQNKELASEAVLSQMAQGALIGAAFGAAFGGVGGGIKGVAGKLASSEAAQSAAEGYIGKRAGLTGSISREIGNMEDGMKGFMSRSEGLLEKEGASLTSNPEAIIKASTKVESRLANDIEHMASALDKSGAPPPNWNNFTQKVRADVVGEILMTPGGTARADGINKALNKLIPVDNEFNTATSFKGWIKGREAIAEKVQSLGSDGPRILAAYDAELRLAMQAAEPKAPNLSGITGQYQAAQLGRRTMQVVREASESRLAAGSAGLIQPQDIGAAGAMAVAGHPLSAATYVAGKAIGRTVQDKLGPALAGAVWKASTASKVSNAIVTLRQNVSRAVDGLFKASNRKVVSESFSRKDLDKSINDFYNFANKSSQDRVNNYIQASQSLALATGMDSVADRAVQDLMKVAPQAPGVAGMNKLRKTVPPNGLTVKEQLFMKKLQVIKNPMSVLQSAAAGKVSKEQIQTLKQVWPETYNLVVTEAQNKIAEMKADNKALPIDKIVQLSLVLDSPLDPIMTKEFIGPVQKAMNTPTEQVQQPRPAPAPSNQAEAESYQTPSENFV